MIRRIGRYEIMGKLGDGGFGSVYRGFDPEVQRVVAIKVLSSQGDASLVSRFRAEAMTAGNLSHDNIVVIYEFGEDAGVPFLAMEYLDGVDLQHIISNKSSRESLTLFEKVEIMEKAAQGLQCAHEHGVVHRDIKPANIMRLKDGSVKIMDFGIARLTSNALTRLTQTGMMIGTVYYMAPEQFKSTEVDALCDIWAYGVVFYELLTGIHPFRANDNPTVMYRITMEEPPPLASLVLGCPPALSAGIHRLLAKDSRQRVQSLEDFLMDLEPILKNLAKIEILALLSKAERLIEADRVDTAQPLIARILKLDRGNQAARQLRERLRERTRLQAVRPKIDALLHEADEQVLVRNFPGAIEKVNSAIVLDPESPTLRSRLERYRSEEQRAKQADELISRGRRALNEGDLTGAFAHFSEALETDPSHDQAPALLSEVKRAMEDRAIQAHIKAVMGQANDLIFIQEYDDAISLLVNLEEKTRGDEQVVRRLLEARQLKDDQETKNRLNAGISAAKELLKRGSFQEACLALEELDRENPDNPAIEVMLTHARERLRVERIANQVDGFIATAREQRAGRRFDEALKSIGQALELDRESGKALALQRTYLDEAQADRDRKRIEAELQHCRDLLKQEKPDEALPLIERLAADYPRDARVAAAKREITGRITEREESRRKEVDRGIRESDRLLAEGHAGSATRLLEEMTVLFPAEPLVRDQLDRARQLKQSHEAQARLDAGLNSAQILLNDGMFSPACVALEELDRQNPNNSAVNVLLQHARERLKAKNTADHIEEFRSKAEGERARGRSEQALELVNRALELDSGNEQTLALRRAIRAEQQADLDRRKVSVELQKCKALAGENKLDQALAAVQRLEIAYPKEAEIAEAKRSIVAKIREQDERERRIEEAIGNAERLLSEGHADDATKLLTALIAEFPDATKLHLLLERSRHLELDQAGKEEIRKDLLASRELAGRREWDKALAVLSKGREKHRECREYVEEAETVERLRDCAKEVAAVEFALESDRLVEAISLAEAAILRFPGEPRLAALLQTARNRRELKDLVGYARRRVANGDLDEARLLLTDGLARFPNSAELREIEGEIEKAQGVDQSVRNARLALQRRAFADARKLITALLKTQPGNVAALQLLQEIETQETEYARQQAYDLGRAEAEQLLRSLHFGSAIEKLQQLLRDFRDDPGLRQDLDRSCAARNQYDRQEAYSRSRGEIRALSAAGKLDEALAMIQSSLQSFPGDPALTADLESVKKAQVLRLERARLDAVIGELEALFHKGDAEGVRSGARALLKEHKEPRAVELLEWAERSIKKTKVIRKEGKRGRPALVWSGIVGLAGIALGFYLLWPPPRRGIDPPPGFTQRGEQKPIAPTLNSISPSSGVQGADVVITLTGTNFEAGAVPTVANAVGVFSGVSVVSSTEITATLTIDYNAPTGPAGISVSAAREFSKAMPFMVYPLAARSEIKIQPPGLNFTGQKDSPIPPQILHIQKATLDQQWTMALPDTWVMISQLTGAGKADLNVRVDPSKLAPGEYASVAVFSSAGRRQKVPIHLHLAASAVRVPPPPPQVRLGGIIDCRDPSQYPGSGSSTLLWEGTLANGRDLVITGPTADPPRIVKGKELPGCAVSIDLLEPAKGSLEATDPTAQDSYRVLRLKNISGRTIEVIRIKWTIVR